MPEFTGELIIKYLDNSLSEQEEQKLLIWLKESDENREIFLTCKKIHSLGKIRHYSQPIPLEIALQKFNSRVESSRRARIRERSIQLTKYAAILVFLLVIPTVLWYVFRENKVNYHTIEIAENDPVKSVLLPDGSKIWINQNSSLTYPQTFDKNERVISLEGEAFFQVKTDSLHPFIVKTNGMHVKVYGTVFNVNTRNQGSIETTLVSGSIGIADSKGKSIAMLVPGQMASFNKESQSLKLAHVNTDLYTSWHKGLYIFDKATLADIAKKIEEVYGIHITINTTKPVSKANFVFRKTQPVDTVLEMLKFVLPIDYKKYNDQVYINLK